MTTKFKYVDLFSGCGGLSLGLEKAGFELALAVEKSAMAAETFYHNFVERIEKLEDWKSFASESTSVETQAEKKLVVKELGEVLECKTLLEKLKEQDIDLVAGGPPCQGFSLAGRRNPEDLRNQLPWQFLEFVSQVQPKAVVIENVSGMGQDFKKHNTSSPFEQLRTALTETGKGYIVQPLLLNAMHYGTPQHRPRILLVGIRKDIAEKISLVTYEKTWKSEYDLVGNIAFAQRPTLAPRARFFGDDILTVADAIGDLNKNGYKRAVNLTKFAKEMRDGRDWMPCGVKSGSKKLQNHRLRAHAKHIELRFRLYQYFRDQGVPPKTLSIPKDDSLGETGKRELVLDRLASAKLPAIAPDGTTIANTVQELVDVVMSLGTKKHSQRPLSWSAPAPTVVSLPDDYVHPDEPRTLTVREMARFQSFPDSFEFRAKETTGSLRRRFEVPQYTQVGNAVPPRLGYAIGKLVYGTLASAMGQSEVDDCNSKRKAV